MTASFHAAEGVRWMSLGEFSRAALEFDRALAENPSEFTALLGQARLRLAQANAVAARSSLKHVLRVEPLHTEALSHLARLDAEEGNEQAVEVLRGLACRLDAGFFEFLNFGRVLLARNRFEEAVSAFELARKSQPDDYHALTWLGLARQGQGQLNEAMDCFLQAAALTERDAMPLVYAARLFAQRGRVPRALELMQQALTRTRDTSQLYPELIRLFLLHGDMPGAVRAAAAFRGQHPRSAEGAYLHGLAMLLSGDAQGAEGPLREAISLAPNTVEGRVALATVRRALKDPAGQLRLLEEAHVLEPRASGPACELAVVYLSQPGGRGRARAVQVLTPALAAHPEDTGLHLNMALALADSDKVRAREHARKARGSSKESIREQAERLLAALN